MMLAAIDNLSFRIHYFIRSYRKALNYKWKGGRKDVNSSDTIMYHLSTKHSLAIYLLGARPQDNAEDTAINKTDKSLLVELTEGESQ